MMLRHFIAASLLSTATMLLSGCSTPSAALSHTPEFAPVYPPMAEKVQSNSGAIFSSRTDNWFGRNKSYQIGDVVTVLLNEETQTERNVAANLNRKSTNNVLAGSTGLSNAIQNISVGGSKLSGVLQGIKMDGAEITNSGGGQDSKTAKLIGAVTVTVVEVLANGNLVVRGEKQLALTEGSEIIQLSGIIRPIDISPSNMVQSSRLANAQIAYRGTGDLANAGKAGWGTSALMKLWPF
jgi:flagellar L-ring protein precursor FlgH